MAAFDHNGVPGSALDRELRGLNCARCDRLSRDLAAALERAKSAGEDAFKLRVDLAAAQEELERVRDKCNEHYMALAAAQEANAKLKAERDRLKAERDGLLRGEYICRSCGLRKNGEIDATPSF